MTNIHGIQGRLEALWDSAATRDQQIAVNTALLEVEKAKELGQIARTLESIHDCLKHMIPDEAYRLERKS